MSRLRRVCFSASHLRRRGAKQMHGVRGMRAEQLQSEFKSPLPRSELNSLPTRLGATRLREEFNLPQSSSHRCHPPPRSDRVRGSIILRAKYKSSSQRTSKPRPSALSAFFAWQNTNQDPVPANANRSRRSARVPWVRLGHGISSFIINSHKQRAVFEAGIFQ